MSTYDHVEPIEGLSPDIEQLALYFAKIMTSPHNQHAIVMFVGQAGTGKSWAATQLAVEVAKKVSERLKEGTPDDYFSFKETFATINRDEVKRVMTKPKKHAVILLDDIGVGWNARKYKDEFNIFLNDIIQTFRPNHNLVIMTMQASFLIDKVPRSLAHYLIEMDAAHFDEGFSLAKVFKINLKHRLGKLYYPYLSVGSVRYYRHIFRMPPPKLMKEYEKIRAEQLERLAKMKEEDETVIQIPQHRITDELAILVKHLSDNKIMSLREAAKQTGFAKSSLSEAITKLGITKDGRSDSLKVC